MLRNIRPAEFTDDDEEDENDYDGFCFAPQAKVRHTNQVTTQYNRYTAITNIHEKLYKCVTEDPNLNELKTTLKENASLIVIDDPLRQGWTLLMYACKSCLLDIVDYFITIGVNVNKQSDSITPLMAACQCAIDFQLPENKDKSNDLLKIVKLLLKNGAELNVTSQLGHSALMFAAANGHKKVVDLFIPLASLEAVDNNGCTAIFHAVENNHPEIVRGLLDAGVLTNIFNRRGYTPKQEAIFFGFQDIADMFPADVEEYIVPTNWSSYSTYQYLVPGISGNICEMPAYFPDVSAMMYGMRMEDFLPHFAKAGVTLEDLLNITDEKLTELGVTLPIERKRIHLGLLRFHVREFTKKSIAKVNNSQRMDLFDFYCMFASHLRQMVIIKASLNFTMTNPLIAKGKTSLTLVEANLQNIKKLTKQLEQFRQMVIAVKSLNPPKPILLMEEEEEKQEKSFAKNIWKLSRLTSVFGMLIVVYFRGRILEYLKRFWK